GLAGPDMGDLRLPTRGLAEGVPEDPVFLPARAAISITGRVYGVHGDDAGGADVEVWELLQPEERERPDDTAPAIRRRATRAAPDGSFRIYRIRETTLLVLASHETPGATRPWILP